jgi:hypothetical protein
MGQASRSEGEPTGPGWTSRRGLLFLRHQCPDPGRREIRNQTYNLTSNLNNKVRLIKEQQKTLICLDCVKTDGKADCASECSSNNSHNLE